VLDEFERAFRLLSYSSRSGHARLDISNDPRLRFWSIYSYLIVFLLDTRPLFIARILHGARSPEELRAELRSPDDAT
jgi:antitoxin ParD1/3/4/toxin ParE1/3/4